MEPDQWKRAVGSKFANARKARGMSKREAARTAGFDEAVWRQIEEGWRRVSGVQVPANPRDENLAAAALAVGLDPAEIFEAVGRTWTGETLPGWRLEAGASGIDPETWADLDEDERRRVVDFAESLRLSRKRP